jgi:hypothetical protein
MPYLVKFWQPMTELPILFSCLINENIQLECMPDFGTVIAKCLITIINPRGSHDSQERRFHVVYEQDFGDSMVHYVSRLGLSGLFDACVTRVQSGLGGGCRLHWGLPPL